MKLTFFSIFILIYSNLFAATFEDQGYLQFESRIFTSDANDLTEDYGFGLSGGLKLEWNFENSDKIVLQAFGRNDERDSSRGTFYLEDFFYKKNYGKFSFLLGTKVFNWSTAEAFHPIDIVNSRNFDGQFENAEKIGEPVLMAEYNENFMNVEAFFSPVVVDPILPSFSNRKSFFKPGSAAANAITPFEFYNQDGEVINEYSKFVAQYGGRVGVVFDSLELNLIFVDHYDRESFIQNITSLGPIGSVTPSLVRSINTGGSLQYIYEGWNFKSEFLSKSFRNPSVSLVPIDNPDYHIASFGVEYSSSHQSGSDSTFIVEYQKIFELEDENSEIFQNDILLGYRYAFNDIKSRELFIMSIFDLNTGAGFENLSSINFSQRMTDVWKVSSGLRSYYSDKNGSVMSNWDKDVEFSLNFQRYF